MRRVDCSGPGIRRVRHGRGFRYLEDGEAVRDHETIERIHELAIPPAWDEVWVCPDPRGHIQATGIDGRGRKQYLYHERWRARQDRLKFDRVLDFGASLPRLRQQVLSDLELGGLARERVLAGAVRLLDLGFFRVGSEQYAADNETYGLATLLQRHVRIDRGAALFDYRAKGAKRLRQEIADPTVLPVLRALKARRNGGSRRLLVYWRRPSWTEVRADEINEHIAELAGGEYTAKDFRTWNATVLAAVAVATQDGGTHTASARKRIANAAVKQVATYLSNTPAVCRASYIDPRVFDRFDSGETIARSLRAAGGGSNPSGFPERERIERAVLRLLG